MTNQQILTKAIQKAIDGGWNPTRENKDNCIVLSFLRNTHDTGLFFEFKSDSLSPNIWSLNDTIFNHDFAKALWNTPRFTMGGEIHFETRDGRSEWQYHLQQMVIAEDPIKYLGENI